MFRETFFINYLWKVLSIFIGEVKMMIFLLVGEIIFWILRILLNRNETNIICKLDKDVSQSPPPSINKISQTGQITTLPVSR